MQGYLYTEEDRAWVGKRMGDGPSWEQLAFMVNLGIKIPRGCTSEQASKLIEKAKPADVPTAAQREAYIRIKDEIADRMRDCKELVDDIIENPPLRPRIAESSAEPNTERSVGCLGVVLLSIATLYMFVR